jgi:hypothetical protein
LSEVDPEFRSELSSVGWQRYPPAAFDVEDQLPNASRALHHWIVKEALPLGQKSRNRVITVHGGMSQKLLI